MKVFLVQFDGTNDYVEAETMQEAITLWQQQMVVDNDGDESFLDQPPDGCHPVSDLTVIRKADKRVSRFGKGAENG